MGLRRFVALGQAAGLLGPGDLSLYGPEPVLERAALPAELLTRTARGEPLDAAAATTISGVPTGELAAAADELRWLRLPAREVTWFPAGNVNLDNFAARGAELASKKALAAILQPGVAEAGTLARTMAAIRTLKEEFGLSTTGLGPDDLQGMALAEGISVESALDQLVAAGLEGFGGPPTRVGAVQRPAWQAMHRLAGAHGLRGPATLTLGLGESREDRLRHLLALRDFQAEELAAGRPGFTAISVWTALTGEAGRDDSAQAWLRTVALARLVLHNFDHVTAWWPSVGLGSAQAALFAGADDLGPALLDALALAAPGRSFVTDGEEVEHHIRVAGFVPVRRDVDWTTLVRMTAAPEGRYARA